MVLSAISGGLPDIIRKVFCSQFLPNVLAMEFSRTTLDAN